MDDGSGIAIADINLNESVINSWPMVYILNNEREAYVGQTTSIARRMSQHGANKEKKAFTRANVIYNEEFNSSVITDYEHRLIELMHADGRFRLTNRNAGLADSDYYSKDEYEAMFEDLWTELRHMDLVKHSIDEIEEMEVFKYSPFKGLTPDQEVALQTILDAIDKCLSSDNPSVTQPIVVEGMPGTGKTVLAIFLLKTLKDWASDGLPEHAQFANLNVRLLEPVTGLRETLQRALSDTVNLEKKDIIGPNDLAKSEFGAKPGSKGFDIVLVDEAHHLGKRVNMPPLQYKYYDGVTETLGLPFAAPQLDWVMDQTRIPIFFYDPLQSIGPRAVGYDRMQERLGEALDHPIELTTQMRVKAGREYLRYIQDVLFDCDPEPRSFEGYDLVFYDDFSAFDKAFERTIAKHDLTRMIAGYAWEWKTSKDKSPKAVDIEISGVGKRWNRTFRDWVGKGTRKPEIAREVGCIHSIQVYDLSNAFVIIGPDLRFDSLTGKMYVDKSSYFDKNGKTTATNEELDRYIRNIYYVLLTRGIESTHVYVYDPALREHLRKYFDCC